MSHGPEARFWTAWLKPLLNGRPDWLAWKIPAEMRKGLPDVWYCLEGCTGWLELKMVPQWPGRQTTPITVKVTPEQLAHLRPVRRAGGRAFVLLGVEDDWYLLDPISLGPMERIAQQTLRCDASGLVVARGVRMSEGGMHLGRILRA